MLLLATASLLSGCDMALMSPKAGRYGAEVTDTTALGLMLIVVVPVIVMAVAFAYKYRASNTSATYAPDWAHSNKIEAVVWTVPVIIIVILAVITWKLPTPRPLQAAGIGRQTGSGGMSFPDWKWLFVYPELGIASVNELAFPVNTPVNFRVTSDTVMNSFFIPQLGGQILRHGWHADQAAPDCQRGGRVQGHLRRLQRCRFLRHEVQGHRDPGPAGFDAWQY